MRVTNFPTRIQIETNNFCNAQCVMCPVLFMKRKHEIMSFTVFETIIKQIKTEKKNFHGWIIPFLNGDPFLVPNYLDYLRLIRKELPSAKIAVDTNASLLTSDIAEQIVDEGLLDLLTASFDGGTKKAYESIRKGLTFETVRDNILNFLQVKQLSKKKLPLTSVKMILTQENYPSRTQFKLMFEHADRLIFSSMHNWGGQIFKDKPSMPRSNFCASLYQNFTIQTDGNVVLCCIDYDGYEKMGNVLDDSIGKIWLGEAFQKRRKYLTNRQFDRLPLCRNCSTLDRSIPSQQLAKLKLWAENTVPNSGNNTLLQWDSFRNLLYKAIY